MFLTTNRVRSFDPAFQTRITVALKYKSLDENAREKVWKNLLGAAGQENAMEDQQIKVKELAKQPMNGREIKNAIRLAPNNYIEAQNWLKITGKLTDNLS